jgi:hypothetical protein
VPPSGGIPTFAARHVVVNVGARRTRSHDDQIPIMGVGHAFRAKLCSALAAPGRRSDMRPAAKAVNERCRDKWRLDLRALSGKTARTVVRDGCEQGLAVHSVRS